MDYEDGHGLPKKIITALLSFILFSLIAIIAFLMWNKLHGFNQLQQDAQNYTNLTETESVTESLPLNNDFTYVTLDNSKVHEGSLILVNNYYEYLGDNSNIQRIYDLKNDAYSVSSYDDSAEESVINALNSMMQGFFDATALDDVNVISAFRTRELQQQLYDEGSAEFVARPGYSEHETGYAIDFGIYNGDWSEEFTGEGDYAWITQNAYKYGFILRYPSGKESVTLIGYEPWHFRYVGNPHAYYINQNNLCLEEYIELVKMYPFNGEHLIITDYDSTEYEIYFVSEDNLSASTEIPVPENAEYLISGDNINGFIVAFKTAQS